MENALTSSLEKNMKRFQKIFQGDSTVICRRFVSAGTMPLECCIFYCDGMVNNQIINENILRPVTRWEREQESTLEDVLQTVLQINEAKQSGDIPTIVRDVLYGDTLFLCQGSDQALVLNTKGFPMRSIAEPPSEQVLRGPREGFTEGILTNISMLRRKIRSPRLKFQFSQVGEETKTTLCICYMEGIVEPRVLRRLRSRLRQVKIDGVLDSNYVQEFIRDSPRSPFKTVGGTEKPDVVAACLLEGRAAVLVDGSPVALTMPYIFMEQFQSGEDYYVGWHFAAISRLIRLVGFLFAISVVPAYVALVTYHQELLPAPLLFSISAAREGVPFPTLLEGAGLLIAFEILREAGERTPAGFGQTLSIVGGLVLGQAAVEARFISAPMVIVVAFSGITGLMLPRLKSPVIWCRLGLLFLSAWMGLYGLFTGLLWLLLHLSSLHSFGVPVLRDAAPGGKGQEDSYFRTPWQKMRRAGRFIAEAAGEK